MGARPSWAIKPLDMNGAAEVLGISRRTLSDALRGSDAFELRGNKKVFYPEHIEQLRREMHECACKSNGSRVGRKSTGPALTVNGSDALSKLRTLAAQKKHGRS